MPVTMCDTFFRYQRDESVVVFPSQHNRSEEVMSRCIYPVVSMQLTRVDAGSCGLFWSYSKRTSSLQPPHIAPHVCHTEPTFSGPCWSQVLHTCNFEAACEAIRRFRLNANSLCPLLTLNRQLSVLFWMAPSIMKMYAFVSVIIYFTSSIYDSFWPDARKNGDLFLRAYPQVVKRKMPFTRLKVFSRAFSSALLLWMFFLSEM